MNTSNVLLVDDDVDLLKAIGQTLQLAGFDVRSFQRAEDCLNAIEPDFPGIVVSDIRMPGMDGRQLFERIRAIDDQLPVILMTGHGDIPMAVDAMRQGVYDFVAKPFDPASLVQSIRRAADMRALVVENRRLRSMARNAGDDLPLIGQTPAMERLRHTLRQIADTDVDVLLTGETGTGKEVVAQLLHQWSRRARGNFVALNCGALPETVLESELFGHEAGAFTGAQKKRIGRIEHSSGGTLFLDEIESMPPTTQVHMLRVLEAREVSPLGTNETRAVDLRVVAAAKVDLSDASQRRDFREDLYYRLNVVAITIPPLRERMSDVPLLFNYFLERAERKFGRPAPPPSAELDRHLREHNWPGNVRELAHFAERCVLGLTAGTSRTVDVAPTKGASLPERVDRYEAQLIRAALSDNAGDVRATIEALGIPRKTFYDKLQRYGIERAAYAPGRAAT